MFLLKKNKKLVKTNKNPYICGGKCKVHVTTKPKLLRFMTYKVIDIEGVGEVYAEKLIAAGIKTDADLLEKCAKPAGRKALEAETGISGKLILKWANHCDLYRINGVGPQFAELLEASGVDTVKELKHRVAENLQKKLEEVNAVKNLTNRVPAVAEVQKMIDQAKELPGMMEY